MNREELGKKITENLGIQGQIEVVRDEIRRYTSQKGVQDEIAEKGIVAKQESDQLAVLLKDSTGVLKELEKELSQSDAELEKINARVPRLISETPPTPTSIKF